MGEVVDLQSKREHDNEELCLHGNAKCSACEHEWQAVAPVGTTELECPHCRCSKGSFVDPVRPSGGYLCCPNDGCELLYVTSEGVQCPKCGETRSYDKLAIDFDEA